MNNNLRATTSRQSNVELLRIIAMVLITAHHFAVHGHFSYPSGIVTINRLWIQFVEIGGKIGVNIFVLISGYFLVTSNAVKTNKVIRLWLQLFTYSILFFVFSVVSGKTSLGLKSLISHTLPITFSIWWFASVYFVLYLLSPYINKLLISLSKESYQKLLLLLLLGWCIIPTLWDHTWGCNELLWFSFLYSLAGYIRLHIPLSALKNRYIYIYIYISIALSAITFLSVVLFDYLEINDPTWNGKATYFYAMDKLPALLISLFLFLGFLRMEIKHSPFINTVSSATFGVYLIHDNYLMREFWWETVLKTSSFQDSKFLIPYSFIAVFALFAVCTGIELVRIHLLEKTYLKGINRISSLADRLIDRLLSSKILDKLLIGTGAPQT